MLVKIMGFGTNWWARFGRDPEDRHRFTSHAAYFNSSGLRCGNKIRRHWIVPGLIRFNGVGDFRPQFPSRSIGEIFECTDLAFAVGGNRVLFVKKALPSTPPDYVLVVISSEIYGRFCFDDPGWKSSSVRPIAVSHLGEKQEALLLMRRGDWVKNLLGLWRLSAIDSEHQGLPLELVGDQ